MPLRYLYTQFGAEELISYYRAADVALLTPLRDGMNLVAKEFVASQVDDDGVLILSEFASQISLLGQRAIPKKCSEFSELCRRMLPIAPLRLPP